MPIRRAHLLLFLLSLNLCPGFPQADSSTSGASILQEGWAQITGQDGEFSIMMPQPVERQEKEKDGKQAIVYFSKTSSGLALLLSRIIKPGNKPLPKGLSEETSLSLLADGYTDKMSEEAKKENENLHILKKTPAQINGRAALQLDCKTESRHDSILVTSSDTSFYILHAIDTEKQPAESKLFIKSLHLNSKKRYSEHGGQATPQAFSNARLSPPAQPEPVPVLPAESIFHQGSLAETEKVKLEGVVFELRPPTGLAMHRQAAKYGKGFTACWHSEETEDSNGELSITVYSSLDDLSNLSPNNLANWAVQKAKKGEKGGSKLFAQPEKIWLNGREFIRHSYDTTTTSGTNYASAVLLTTTVAGMAVLIHAKAFCNDQKVKKGLEECLKTIKIQ